MHDAVAMNLLKFAKGDMELRNRIDNSLGDALEFGENENTVFDFYYILGLVFAWR